MTIPIIINCRDRLEPLLALLQYLERANQEEIYLVDNDSSYPPLLEYLAGTSHRVLYLGRNAESRAVWDANVLSQLGITGRFVVSDPDVVPDPACPPDAIEYFSEVLDHYPARDKVGFGLRIDDLPDAYRFKHEVIDWESQFWENEMAPRLYDADIATTFALYRRPMPFSTERSVRTGYPYVARHMPWYVDEQAVPEDEAFYRTRASGAFVHWGRGVLPAAYAQAIADRRSRAAISDTPGVSFDSSESRPLLSTSGWAGEPQPYDEVRNTPWCDQGWHSWNAMSPEVEICDFVAALVEVVRPSYVIETGTGQGYITRRVERRLREGQQLVCFESDPAWRQALSELAFFDGARCVLSPDETPDEQSMAAADLSILDSASPYRLSEIERWWRKSRRGAILLVHDAGNGHGPETPHARVRAKLEDLGIPGILLNNPRGAFLGIKLARDATDAYERLAMVENELQALRRSKTVRYSAPLRQIYAKLWRPLQR